MLDAMLVVGVAVTQVIVTWYAVDISVRENRKRNAAVIGVVGLLGIILTGWAAVRSGNAQEELRGQVTAMGKDLKKLSANKNASVIVLRFSNAFGPQKLLPDRDMMFHVTYQVKDNTAKNVRVHHEAFSVPGSFSQTQARRAYEEFQARSVKYLNYAGETLVAESTTEALLSLNLNRNEISEVEHLPLPIREVYFMARVEWDNPSGSHDDFLTCRVMTSALMKTLVGEQRWYPCFH
jgi:hypothetical protein